MQETVTLLNGEKKTFNNIYTIIGDDERDQEDFLDAHGAGAGLILEINGRRDPYPYRNLVLIKETPEELRANRETM